jgi:ribosome-binding protein aMBF1 (putative translation factor)
MAVSERQGKRAGAGRQSRLVTFGPDKHERELVLLGFGDTLRGLRREARLSQEALAMRCFMRRDEIGGFESGRRVPDLLALLVLSEARGVDRGAHQGAGSHRG